MLCVECGFTYKRGHLDSEQSPVDDSVQKKNRKRKRPKAISKMEKSPGVVMDKFILGQRETENKYMALEEKTLKVMQELENVDRK